jgi:lysophospholipase L1-like esterase
VGGSAAAGASGTAGASGGGYSPCPAAPSPCVILPFGDSITYGYGSTDAGGYRSQVFALAIADGKSLTFVGSSADGPSMVSGKAFPRQHEGHAGYTITGSKGIAQYVDQGIIKQFKPNIVLLMIGTNDISQTIDLSNAPQRLGKLIDSIFADAPNALIVVAKITPSQKEPANTNTTTYNAALPALIQTRTAQGKHLALVDMNTPFLANSNWKKALMTDSVHPNDAGYAILGKTWYVALRDVLR